MLALGGGRLSHIPLAALWPTRTCNVEKQLWHLQLDSGEALFGKSGAFRKLGVYIDDDLTRQQLAGRLSLSGKRQVAAAPNETSCKTWWRHDTLWWSDAGGVPS